MVRGRAAATVDVVTSWAVKKKTNLEASYRSQIMYKQF